MDRESAPYLYRTHINIILCSLLGFYRLCFGVGIQRLRHLLVRGQVAQVRVVTLAGSVKC